MIADGAGEHDLVAGANRRGGELEAGNQAADAGGGDVHLVGFAVLDDFRVASRDDHAGALGCGGHRADFGFENIGGQPGFEHVAAHQRDGACAGNGEIVDGAIHCELANGAPGKAREG